MSRRGYLLVELLVAMSMTGVVLTVGLGMLHCVMREQRSADREQAMHRVSQRLSTALREDIHRAHRAELTQAGEDGKQGLVLYQPGARTVTYVVSKSSLEWRSIQDGEPAHRDSFSFPDDYRLQFLDVSAERVTFTAFAFPQVYLAMEIGKSREEEFDTNLLRAVMRVEAWVGRDHRFCHETGELSEP